MWYPVRDKQSLTKLLAIVAALLASIFSLASCARSESVAAERQVAQKTFASPAEAGAALLDAAKSPDHGALLAIFGPGANDVLLFGGDKDGKNSLQDFVSAYNQMHRWRGIKVGGQMLYVGAVTITSSRFLWARIPQASGTLTALRVRTKLSRGVLARTSWLRLPPAALLTRRRCNITARRTTTTRSGNMHRNSSVMKANKTDCTSRQLTERPSARSRKFVSSRKPPVTPRRATIRSPSTATGSEY